MSQAFKDAGNAAFKAKDYDEAIKQFSEGISVDGENHVLYSNRSAAFASKQDYGAALADAEKCITCKSDWAKGYGRKGAALVGMGRYDEAIAAYEEGLAIDGQNQLLIGGLDQAKKASENAAKQAGAGGLGDIHKLFSSPEALAKLAMNPQTAGYMKQPDFMKTLQEIQSDPTALQRHFQDPRVLECLGVVMGVNIQTPNQGDATETAEQATEEAKEEPKKEEVNAPEPAAEPEPMEVEETEEDKKKKESLAEKELGTQAYKKKDFETALKHYNKAAELDQTNMVFHLNIGAVYYEQKDYKQCIESCKTAKEIGGSNRADYKTLAKADARAAKAYVQMGELEEAVKSYDKALTNNRSADYLNAKKKLEKHIKEKKRLEYIDEGKSLEAKERGNEKFKSGDFPGAIAEYTEAIARNPENGKLYSNRAAAYTKLAELPMALKDCEACIKLEPTFIKGYLRKGNILLGMKKVSEAQSAFQKAQQIDGNHPEVRDGLTKCQQALYGGNMSREERASQAMNDPEIQAILRDPVMQSILQQMQEDPSALREHMKNPDIAAKLQKLISSGIMETR